MNAIPANPSSTPSWQPPLHKTVYRCSGALTSGERVAIALCLQQRSKGRRANSLSNLPDGHPLEALLRPVRDALEITGSRPSDRSAAMAVLLRECIDTNSTFWIWSRERWGDVLGRDAGAFRVRNQSRVSQSVRIEIAAVAYLHAWFRDVSVLGQFRRDVLAKRVFGSDAVSTAAELILKPLGQWGYRIGQTHMSCLCEALLRNESPHVEHLTREVLEGFRQDASSNRRFMYFQFSKALASHGVIDAPLPVAQLAGARAAASATDGALPAWIEWIERWTRTSTLDNRDNIRHRLFKLSRWLGQHHSNITSPEQWTRELCAEYVAAVCRMRVGDYTARRVRHRRVGQLLSPGAMASELASARTFFHDCQQWGWIHTHFDPGRSLALPRSVKARLGPKPRVIADDLWARLLKAGLELTEADLPRPGRYRAEGHHAYPLPFIRALAIVWLFTGLRSDEIRRLRVGCVRWQRPTGDAAGQSICVLDVPIHKTGADFSKPVDPEVGRAVEAWEKVRPKQPKYADHKTGESVDLLFMYRAQPIRRQQINQTIIPMLCRKAGIPTQDARGTITSHRARATIASQLFNSREPMSLFELQAWLGHGSPSSTRHYVAITPAKLARAYADAGYFERNVRAIEVLVDQDTLKQAAVDGESWRFYDLGHGVCSYEFFDQCTHRMACVRCDFYRPRQSYLLQLLEARQNILRLVEELPITDEERAVVDDDLKAIGRLIAKLGDLPTPPPADTPSLPVAIDGSAS